MLEKNMIFQILKILKHDYREIVRDMKVYKGIRG